MSAEHVPVLCEETIDLVTECAGDWQEGQTLVFVDATFGRGGHSRALLKRLGPRSRLIAIDRDRDALAAGAGLAAQDPRLTLHHARFSELAGVLSKEGVAAVRGVIMDLGVSSPQLDDPARGFSFRLSGPIDMRMDPSRGEPAGDWLNRAAEAEIARVIREYGEERYARRIAAAIVRARPLTDTRTLADVVRSAVPGGPGAGKRSDSATRTFQAIRIQVNEELDEVVKGVRAAFQALSPGGRLAVISFHSLEDRLVKKTFRELARGADLPRGLPVRAVDAPVAGRILKGPVRAGAREVADNPRARSATLRVLERVA